MQIGMIQGAPTGGYDGGCQLLAKVRHVGLSGLEVFFGSAQDEMLGWSVADIDRFAAAAKDCGIALMSTALGAFNNDAALVQPSRCEAAVALVERTLDVTKALGADVMLLCTYIQSHPDTEAKKDALLDVLKRVEPGARARGVTIALESPLPAKELRDLTDTAGSDRVQIYYDVGNAVGLGFDPAREIPVLGHRIVSVHVKDSAGTLGGLHLGEGQLDLDAAMQALNSVAYDGWLVLETPADDESAFREDVRKLKTAIGTPA